MVYNSSNKISTFTFKAWHTLWHIRGKIGYTMMWILLCLNIVVGQSILEKAPQSSEHVLAFRLNNAETKNIYQYGIETVNASYFHDIADSTDSNDFDFLNKKLPFGNYIVAYISENKFHYKLKSVRPFQYALLNNNTDFKVVLYDSAGAILHNYSLALDKNTVKFNEQIKAYKIAKKYKGGVLEIKHKSSNVAENEVVYYEKVGAKYPKLSKRIVLNIINSFPLKILTKPPKDIYLTFKYKYAHGVIRKIKKIIEDPAGYFEEKRQEKNQEKTKRNFIVFNKPKYLPGDTVKFKIAVFGKNGKLKEKDALRVNLNTIAQNFKEKHIMLLNPYSKGLYESSFVLHDSLRLPLGVSFYVYAENKKENVLAEGMFQYEQYNLKTEKYTIKPNKNIYYEKDTVKLNIEAEGENNMPLVGTKLRLYLINDNVEKVLLPKIFVPDTLFTLEKTLADTKNNEIILPDSIFPKANMQVRVKAEFVSVNNILQNMEVVFTKNATERALKIEFQNDSLLYTSPNEQIKEANIVYQQGNNTFVKYIKLPYAEYANNLYEQVSLIANDSVKVTLKLDMLPKIEVNAEADSDSLVIQISNKLKQAVWYSLYQNNKKIDENLRGLL
jgi:alpha-2-macroglobulin